MEDNSKLMGIAEYAESLLYKNKKITVARVWQLISSGKLTLAHKKPAIVFAQKID